MIPEHRDKKIEDPSSLTLRVDTPVYGGFVLGRDGKVIFVRGAIPRELVEVNITETRRDYSIAEVTRVIEPSEFRRTPPCPYYGQCGGCQLQHIQYEKQVNIKEDILAETLLRLGDIKIDNISSITEREFSYRQRVQFKVSKSGRIGFFREGTRDIVTIDRCLIITEPINNLLSRLRDIALRGVRELHVISGDTLSVLIKGEMKEENIQALINSGVSGIAFENGDSIGKDYITLEYEGLKYTVTPWGFFQGHWALNKKVVSLIIERLSPLEDRKVLDLYSGAGNFSLPIAMRAAEVVAVEENPYAIEDGKRNLIVNGIKNCLFIHSPVDSVFNDRRKKRLFEGRRYDIIILDPPRPGLTRELCKSLIEIEAQKIVYISCNPSTLARDLKRLREKYDIEAVYMADFFPNTYHIETIAFLRLR